MESLEKLYGQASCRIEAAEHQRRVEARQKREAKRKEEQRRFYIVGEMVCRHLPQLNDITPSKNKVENKRNFAALETILNELAANQKLMATIKEKTTGQVVTQGHIFLSDLVHLHVERVDPH